MVADFNQLIGFIDGVGNLVWREAIAGPRQLVGPGGRLANVLKIVVFGESTDPNRSLPT